MTSRAEELRRHRLEFQEAMRRNCTIRELRDAKKEERRREVIARIDAGMPDMSDHPMDGFTADMWDAPWMMRN